MKVRMRFARVSAFFAVCRRQRIAYLFAALMVLKNELALGCSSSSRSRSAGTVADLNESYAASHRPSRFARSTSSSPAGLIRPLAMSARAFSRLRFDQMLLTRRGMKRCSHAVALSGLPCASIQP
jgi:hypothetical protein